MAELAFNLLIIGRTFLVLNVNRSIAAKQDYVSRYSTHLIQPKESFAANAPFNSTWIYLLITPETASECR